MPVIPQDPFGPIKNERGSISPTSQDVKAFHDKSDRDAGIAAEHHTLGAKRGQASPGDHIHDGKGCRKLQNPFLENANVTLNGKLVPATVAEVDALVDQLVTWFALMGFNITDARS